MENSFEIIDKRLERIELLLEKLFQNQQQNNISEKTDCETKMPSQEEMDAYILKRFFSDKKYD
ncbi:hypothetical protein [Maribacter thermophilus]|uniref:hypothetical protein n=1 Tax=Maribacter thermophilus TaxID=1197874 RepID=UPI0006416A39|nr:hypothetical protein [Maribacter thermophilus]